ncbi:MAG: T9SS type A sorting domain-containing protein, partial [Bacteroidota bacterium]|nr:T9SS type A sorting domain-containing protein [Bacteroidota bacterium]
ISADLPQAQDGENCGPGSVELIAQGNGLKTWFADSLGEDLLFMGDTFNTPFLAQDTEYYVETYAYEQADNVGKTDNSGGGGNFTSAFVHHLVFDCYAAVRLVSVKVYAGSAGTRTISLNDENGNPIQQKDIYIPVGESRITLNFDIQPGINYQLQGPVSPDMFRNNNLVNEYPFNLEGIISIKHSSASSAPTSYYYYFYDWEIFQQACETELIPVMALIQPQALAGFNFLNDSGTVSFTNTSTDATYYAWDFGDGQTSLEANPIHHYSQTGVFEVSLIAENACGPDTVLQSVNITITSIEKEENPSSLLIYPNPSEGIVNLSWSIANFTQEINIEVYNLLGEKIWNKSIQNQSEKNKQEIDISQQPKGIYFIRITNKNINRVEKIVLH